MTPQEQEEFEAVQDELIQIKTDIKAMIVKAKGHFEKLGLSSLMTGDKSVDIMSEVAINIMPLLMSGEFDFASIAADFGDVFKKYAYLAEEI
jgi:poly-gamma-glutamate capsule biosynthesis protein CapA/YwtB (metallophosphatase superfamily)